MNNSSKTSKQMRICQNTNKEGDTYTHMLTLIVVIYSIQMVLLNMQTVKNKQQEWSHSKPSD